MANNTEGMRPEDTWITMPVWEADSDHPTASYKGVLMRLEIPNGGILGGGFIWNQEYHCYYGELCDGWDYLDYEAALDVIRRRIDEVMLDALLDGVQKFAAKAEIEQ